MVTRICRPCHRMTFIVVPTPATVIPQRPCDICTFRCEICGKAMTSQSSLNQHISSIHENKYPYSCRICGTAFKIKSNLRNHYSTVHIKEKLTCPEEGCTATFNSRCEYSVTYLYTVHIKEKLTCPEEGCTATFNSRCEYYLCNHSAHQRETHLSRRGPHRYL